MSGIAGNALVTGGSRGIGRSCALALARRGADVAITYVENADAAAATAEEIRALGRRAAVIQGDVSVAADNVAAVEAAIAELGPLRYLVANAANGTFGMTEELTVEQWDFTMAAHVRSLLVLAQAASPSIASNGGGAIVRHLQPRRPPRLRRLRRFRHRQGGDRAAGPLSRGRGRAEGNPRQLRLRRRRPHRPLQGNPRVGGDRRGGRRTLAAGQLPWTPTRSVSRWLSCSPTRPGWSPARRSASTPASPFPDSRANPERGADGLHRRQDRRDERHHDGVLRAGRGHPGPAPARLPRAPLLMAQPGRPASPRQASA